MFQDDIYKLKDSLINEWCNEATTNKAHLDSVMPKIVRFKIIDFIDNDHCILEWSWEKEEWEPIQEPIKITDFIDMVEDHQCTPSESGRLTRIIED